jgi:F0F1-type ATP synthase epsilon subunit
MKLVIVSPQQKNTYLIESIEAQTNAGNLVIKQGHAPIIMTIAPNTNLSFVLKTGEKIVIHVTRPGFLDVNRKSAIALLNQDSK